MAITGIDTIEGKQIIAAGAVSAKSAGMAYNDENGNPITGYLTAVPEGYATTADLTGKQDTLTFGYNESNAISSINESAIGGGSAPTYGYTDNSLISAIDSSGLYAASAYIANNAISADALNKNGTMGGNILQSSDSNYFYYMPQFSPWTTATIATGIFSPLQYATGACLAMDAGYFKAYFKGNEWYVSNTAIGQALRGEVHVSRIVHISGATTAGKNFDLSPTAVRGTASTANSWLLNANNVSGVNSTGSWKYGPAEDAALRAVSSCDMHESAFSYDASDNITAYNGSAFKAGDEFPQSATEAIEAVTANSGAWGGSALPISAGPGIKVNLVDNTLVFSNDETELYTANAASNTIVLSEKATNFERLRLELQSYQSTMAVNYTEVKPNDNYLTFFAQTLIPAATYPLQILGVQFSSTNGITYNMSRGVRAYYKTTSDWGGNDSTDMTSNIKDAGFITKIVGINRIAGGN